MFSLVWVFFWVPVWFSVFLHISSESCPSDSCTDASINESSKKIGYRLANHVTRTVKLEPGFDCFFHCFLECDCVSFNLKNTLAECELNSENADGHLEDLKPDSSYTYMEVLLKTPEKCTSTECKNMCCISNPCQNGATCEELCNDPKRKYQCTCPVGYTGRKCDAPLPPPDPCDNVNCGDGTCVPKGTGYYCNCPANVYGKSCEHAGKWSTCGVITLYLNTDTFYVVSDCKITREEARQACQAVGARLAKLNTQFLLDQVAKVVSDQGYGDLWFGLRRYGNTQYKWDDGTSLQNGDYTAWMSGHPTFNKGECVELKDGKWESDQGCTHKHEYVCELQ